LLLLEIVIFLPVFYQWRMLFRWCNSIWEAFDVALVFENLRPSMHTSNRHFEFDFIFSQHSTSVELVLNSQ